MTFVNHTIGGAAVGFVMAYALHAVFGVDFWLILVILNALIGLFPDGADWVIYKLSHMKWWKWKVWKKEQFKEYCHPPYDPTTGHGKIDRYMKWFPAWGLHTWVTDSIIHQDIPKFIFPKFPMKWTDEVWIRFSPAHWNIQWTKWDVLYVTVEVILTIIYIVIIALTVI